MTPSESLAEVLRLSELATPGEWRLWGNPDPNQVISSPKGFIVSTVGGNDVANAQFIAAAVNFIRNHAAAIDAAIAAQGPAQGESHE